MAEWYNSLNVLQVVYFWIAVPAFLLLILQTVLSVFGADHDADMDADLDVDIDCLSFFTIRGLVAFFTIGGCVGFFVAENENLWWLAILLSIVCGILALIGTAYLVKYIMKLTNEGNVVIDNAVGKKGSVYIRIPEKGSGTGKVNVIVQESYMEYDAMTNGEELVTGTSVVITGVQNGVLIVEKDI